MALSPPPAFSEFAKGISYSRNQWLPYFVGFLIGYPLLIKALRHRRLGQMKKKFHFPTRESMAKMTDEEAFLIQKEMAQLEFPFMFLTSGQFALFRVCSSIPCI